ncbi:MAG: sulfatase-like hydrolase/transferase [Candidatus Eisenbacteria sp.]|nr:sulfatase-like hydrolase/transferase [Candidatus Eisenbacteria bacterium]
MAGRLSRRTAAQCLIAAIILGLATSQGCTTQESSRDESRSDRAAGTSRPGSGGYTAEGTVWAPIAPSDPPTNLILITLDTTRRDHLSCYGFPMQTTPHLDRIAAEGVLFEEAFTPIPVTLPAHATIMTGLYPFQHGVRHNGTYVLPDDAITLAELLGAKGYDTGAVLGAFPVDQRFGLAQGFNHYDDDFSSPSKESPGDYTERPADEVTRLSLAWIDEHTAEPFFLWAHYFDPHGPYEPPEPYLSRLPDDPYSGEIAFMDGEIGLLMDGLKSRGLVERTMILIAGDHGESLGEHGEEGHSVFIYGATQEVPLLLRLPDGGIWMGAPWRNHRVAGLASLTDLLPTAWNALGFAREELPPCAGRSLLPVVLRTGPAHAWLYHETLVPNLDYGMSDLRGLQVEWWKYIRAPQQELYNLDKDPKELHNLAGRELARVEAMEAQLMMILEGEEQADAPMAMDEETIEKLRSLGYLGGSAPKKTARADPKELTEVRPVVDRALELSNTGQVPEALVVLDSLLRVRPHTRIALRLRAHCLMRRGRGPEALEAYDRAIADCSGCPDEFGLLKEQARAYLLAGQPKKALEQTRTLLEERPQEPGLNVQLGEILQAQGDYAGAHQAYEQEAELFPTETSALIKVGQLYTIRKRIREAERAYRQALKRRPDDLEALAALADLLDATGQRVEAERLSDRALSIDPDSPAAHYRKAWILRKSGRKEEAIAHYKAAGQGMPNSGRLRFELGSLYSELGRTDLAETSYEKAIELGNAPGGAYANLGSIRARAGEFSDAIVLWQQALSKGLSTGEADQIRGHIRRAQEMMRGHGEDGR